MKILVLTHEFPPVGGGGGHVAKDLCEGLADLGHEIIVLTADLIGGVTEERGFESRNYGLLRIPTLRKDLARASLPAMFSYIFNSIFKGYFLIRKWKPDVIHVHFAVPAGPIAWVLSKITGTPYLLTAHLGDVPGGTPDKTGRWFKVVKPFTYPIWNDASKVVAVSKFTRSLALKHYPVSIEVIHNGVDTSLFDSGSIDVNMPPRIVFAGRFVPQKNPLHVIKTMTILKDLEWNLVMMGDGALLDVVKSEIEKNKLNDRVTLTGWISPEEVKKEFQRSDILFMPSLSEGLPVVGVQALAAGLAFVVSDIGGFIDIVEENINGFRVPLGGSVIKNLFAEKLSLMINDRQQLFIFKTKSLELAQKFDLKDICLKYEILLRHTFS